MDDADFQESSFNTKFSSSNQSFNRSSKSSKRFLFVLAGVFLLGVVVFAATRLIGSNKSEDLAMEATPVEVIEPTEEETPTPQPPTATPTTPPTPTPTSKVIAGSLDKTTGLDRSKLSIEVLNGGGVAGAAGKAADYLKSLGYRIVSTGNADNFDYETTTLQLKSSSSSYLSLLKKDLSENYSVGTASSSLSATSSSDAVVIIGKE